MTVPSLADILKSFPEELYRVDTTKAIVRLCLSISFYVLGIFVLSQVPWFVLPIGWIFLGIVFSGLTAVGYDCGIGAFSKNKTVNYLIGNIVLLPLLVPYQSWIYYNANNYGENLARLIQGPLWWFSSGFQWLKSNFSLFIVFKSGNRLSLIGSISFLYIFAFIFFPLMFYFGGIWGLCKYWLFPWIIYHLWMSAFIRTSYKTCTNEDKTETILVVHCRYPKWVEYLSNDMNYIVMSNFYFHENLSRWIPSYNVKLLYRSLQSQWNSYVTEIPYGRALLRSLRESILPLEKVNWPTASFILITTILAFYGLFTVSPHRNTLLVTLIFYYGGGLGITAGYHRMWAHRSYNAILPYRILMLIAGTSCFEGSVLWWARDHRAHHRFSDTEKDPYGVDRGLFWAHIGWLLVKQDHSKIGVTDMSDLQKDPMLVWQAKYYIWLALLIGIGLPTLICGLGWGDWQGGFFIASMARVVFVMQGTFCINSLAHYWGSATFSDQRSPRDSYIVSLITFGEGFHNFHHEFPSDYRNGVKSHAYDPGKWLVYLLSFLGITYNLKRFPKNEIDKGEFQMEEKRLERRRGTIQWGPHKEDLPVMTMQEVKRRVHEEGASLIVINNFVHDVADFIKLHPGGLSLIQSRIGTDATGAFNGQVYKHSYSANNLLSMMRIGILPEIAKPRNEMNLLHPKDD